MLPVFRGKKCINASRSTVGVAGVALLLYWVWTAVAYAQPPTPVRTVTENFFGREIEDPFRWLENVRDEEVMKWLKDQNDYTRAVLDKIPERREILARIREIEDESPRQLFDPARDRK